MIILEICGHATAGTTLALTKYIENLYATFSLLIFKTFDAIIQQAKWAKYRKHVATGYQGYCHSLIL